ncbi:MAG: adenylate/guanylate cyclase domain-containing protein, partial [Candidatus Limnocylindrales bacterium]
MTVLFADLVGFTAASRDRDPEDVREFLSRYFEVSREIIERYGGTVEKFIGDAVMAVWGTPVANEDDAERAVRAAMDLVEAVPAIRIGSVGSLAARAAALTGEAAVTLGAQGEGMVAGDLVNTASRLQSVAPAGAVLVGEATFRAASQGIAFESAGDHLVKGKELPIAAWRAVRVIAGVRGMGRQTGIEPPFVGRDAELQLLRDLYHATVRERRPRLVSVIGVAGIGKSRLSWELLKYLDGLVEVLYWHQGRSPAYGEGVTFWALGEMVRRRAGLAEVDDEPATREKVAAMLEQFVPDEDERRWIGPRLLALLGLEEVPAGQREELFAAWRTFFERVADQAPVVMVFEDLHWADSGLIDFIESILEWSKGRSILVVTLARPELIDRRPTWGAGQRQFSAVHLEPLPDPAMTDLVEGMAPGLPDAAVRRIVGQADGIPLYAVETFRMLLDSGRLEAVEGGIRATGSLDKLDIPPTLHALIAARLDALAVDDRALLQSASVLGKTFTLQGLSAVSEQSAEDIEPRLRAITRRELIELDRDPRSPERGQYGFVQSVIREVAYGTLGRRERRARHLAAARFSETLGDDELAGILASHYVDAYEASPEGPEAEAVAAQARVTLRGAAERAMALHSHDQASALYRQALTVTSDPAELAAIRERLGDAAYASSRFDAAKTALREAIDWYEANARPGDAIRATTRLGAILLHEGEVAEGVAALE